MYNMNKNNDSILNFLYERRFSFKQQNKLDLIKLIDFIHELSDY